ncbi:MAG TPA: hypothetical protein DIC35_03685 [Candidatus Moranbacteria bacterium]|nr:hypothetical protein [Candidatus Moranbacteria bacterium]
MKNTKKIFLSLFLIVMLAGLSGCGCKQNTRTPYTINLEVWGLFDDEDAFRVIFENYGKINKKVGGITYRKMTPDSYQKELIDALASGQGPDIFLVHNNWIPSFSDKVYPAPMDIINEQRVRNEFVDVVADDFVSGGSVYALPLSVDSLGLYYNKDLFNDAGITSTPKNWEDFVSVARKLTKLDEQNQIIQSGAALGTSTNINRATDVLNLLMLQNNTEMVNPNSKEVRFDKFTNVDGNSFSPGENALNFYTQFASRNSQLIPYTWNQRLHYSIDAFSEGTLGMMFNYSWQREVLDSKAPKLNYDVALVPQFPGRRQVNFANYWGYTVIKNKTPDTKGMDPAVGSRVTNDMRAKEAWNLLVYLTTNPNPNAVVGSKQDAAKTQETMDPAKTYLERTKKPAARRDLVEMQKTDAKYGVFAEGNLIAKSWYQIAPDSIESIFSQMITQINNGEVDIHSALQSASLAVTKMMNK